MYLQNTVLGSGMKKNTTISQNKREPWAARNKFGLSDMLTHWDWSKSGLFVFLIVPLGYFWTAGVLRVPEPALPETWQRSYVPNRTLQHDTILRYCTVLLVTTTLLSALVCGLGRLNKKTLLNCIGEMLEMPAEGDNAVSALHKTTTHIKNTRKCSYLAVNELIFIYLFTVD